MVGRFSKNLSALNTPALPSDTLKIRVHSQHDLFRETKVTRTFLVIEMSHSEACKLAIGRSTRSKPFVSSRYKVTVGILLNAGPVIAAGESHVMEVHTVFASFATQ